MSVETVVTELKRITALAKAQNLCGSVGDAALANVLDFIPDALATLTQQAARVQELEKERDIAVSLANRAEVALMTANDDRDRLKAEVERLKGIQPELPVDGDDLVPRYGLRWNGPESPLSVPMKDGFWTPWHMANAELERLRGFLSGGGQDVLDSEQAWRKRAIAAEAELSTLKGEHAKLTEEVERIKEIALKNRLAYTALLTRLKQPEDMGGHDGWGQDALHVAASNTIEDLLTGLASQIDIANASRAEVTRLTARWEALKADADHFLSPAGAQAMFKRMAELEAQR